MTHVVVVASAVAVRSGLRTLLSAGETTQVSYEAATLKETLPLPLETDVLILVAEPTELPYITQNLLDAEPVPVLILLVAEDAHAAQILAALYPRAWGLLPLDATEEELLAAVEAVRQGLFVCPPALLGPFSQVVGLAGDMTESRIEALTHREIEVLHLLAQGLANKQIAARLSISEHTVKFHVSAIYQKIGASNRTEAVRLGVRQGLILL